MNERFLLCNKCGNLVITIEESGIPILCCGKPMEEIIPNSVEAAFEKHIPIYEVDGNKVIVKVSDVTHPMIKEHYIKWIILKTTKGFQKKNLNFGDQPEAEFLLDNNEKIICAYSYCNLHGLWKSN